VNYSNARIVPVIYPITCKHRTPAIYGTVLGLQGDFVVASGSSLVLPRAAADTGGQCSMLRYTGGSAVRHAVKGQQRGRRRGGEKEGRGNGGRGKGSRSDCWW
jgi:hypothetical protein